MDKSIEAALIAEQFRALANKFTPPQKDEPRGFNWEHNLKTKAGELLIRSFELGRLSDIEGLKTLVDWVRNPPAPPENVMAFLVPCPANLFLEFCGYHTVQAKASADGTFEITRGLHGGLLPVAFPATFPPFPKEIARDAEQNRVLEHYANVCRWLADWVKENSTESGRRGDEGANADLLEKIAAKIPATQRSPKMTLTQFAEKRGDISKTASSSDKNAAQKKVRAEIAKGVVRAQQCPSARGKKGMGRYWWFDVSIHDFLRR